MRCIYCHNEMFANDKTNEHVIPQWLIKKLGIKKQKLKFIPISRKLEIFRITEPVPHTLTYKVCSSRNNGWLNDIDNSCKDFLNLLIDDKLTYNLINQKNITLLKTLVYKIFLNYLATSPSSFREDKSYIYNDFFKNKVPFDNIDLYLTDLLQEEYFCISHLDHWKGEVSTKTYVNFLNKDIQQSIYNPIRSIRFKFYLQLGKVGFVLCSTGNKNMRILYDNRYLIPVSVCTTSKPSFFNFSEPCHPLVVNNIVHRILYNLIQLDFCD